MLPDYLASGLDVIFCGTAAGRRSAERGHYYAGPGNRFWTTLAEVGLTPRLLAPEEDHLMPGLGLGFTDLAKGVAGQDSQIPAVAYTPARLVDLVAQWRPRAVAFTSLTAARIALGAQHPAGRVEHDRLPDTAIFVLPSPSGLARGYFRIGPSQALADWRRAVACSG